MVERQPKLSGSTTRISKQLVSSSRPRKRLPRTPGRKTEGFRGETKQKKTKSPYMRVQYIGGSIHIYTRLVVRYIRIYMSPRFRGTLGAAATGPAVRRQVVPEVLKRLPRALPQVNGTDRRLQGVTGRCARVVRACEDVGNGLPSSPDKRGIAVWAGVSLAI